MDRRTLLGTIPASVVGAAGVAASRPNGDTSVGEEPADDGGDGTSSQRAQGTSEPAARSGTVVGVQDADTVTVQFADGSESQVRLLGVDAPEVASSRQHERPEEWEGLAYRDDRSLLRLRFDSTCSLQAPDGGPLADDSIVVVRSAATGRVDDTDGEGPTASYDDDVPLVAADGRVVGFGAIMVDGAVNFEEDNEEFLLNAWDALVDGDVVLWDESHDQYYDTDQVSAFPKYASDHGYAVRGSSDLAADLPDADAVVITSPSEAFSSEELDALASFVDAGGAIFLHSQADFQGYDETENLNAITDALDLAFRFSDDQVFDDEHNAGEPFIPVSRNFTGARPAFFADRPGVDGVPARSSETLLSAAAAATAFTRERLLDREVTVSFDANEPETDQYDRLLGYVSYAPDGDGGDSTASGDGDGADSGGGESGRDERLFNRELVDAGHARVYGSSFERHREFRLAEAEARDDGRGVWATSDVDDAPSYRNRRVRSLFFPKPASVRTVQGELPRDRAPVRATSTATQAGSPTIAYDVAIPLVGVDPAARVAAIGAPLIDERYERLEGYPVDTSGYENHAFVANLARALSGTSGDVLVDGGHGQYGAAHAPSSEDAAYFQRFLEGQGLHLEQRNDLTVETLADGQALVVGAPTEEFTTEALEAVGAFRDQGGSVVLLGSGAISSDRVGYLNQVASALGSDLRFNRDAIADPANQLANDPTVFETRAFAAPYGGVFEPYDGNASLPARAERGASGPADGATTSPPPTTVPRRADASVGPLDGLLLPGGIAAGGLTVLLAALGLRRGADEAPVDAEGASSRDEPGEPADARADGGGDAR